MKLNLIKHARRCQCTLMLHIIISQKIIQYVPKLFCFLKNYYYYGLYQHNLTFKFQLFLLTFCTFDMKNISIKFQVISLGILINNNVNISLFFCKISYVSYVLQAKKFSTAQNQIFMPFIIKYHSYMLLGTSLMCYNL